MRSFWLVLIIALIIIVAGAWFVYYFMFASSSTSSSPIPSPEPVRTSSEFVVPGEWETYFDEKHDYTISYPSDYELTSNGENSIQITKKIPASGAGPANFIYVSVIPAGSTNEQGTIYNYDPQQYEYIKGIEIGETRSVTENRELDEYYMYSRNPDVVISNFNAKLLTNTQPWEFPAGTTEYRYYVEKEGTMYLIGGYIGSKDNPYFIPQATLQSIVSSFTLD